MEEPTDARLGELVDLYQRRRRTDAGYRLERMRADAGPLYGELVALVESVHLVESCFAPEPTASARRRSWLLPALFAAVALALGVIFWNPETASSATAPSGQEIPAPLEAPYDWPALERYALRFGVVVRGPRGTPPRPRGKAALPAGVLALQDAAAAAREAARFPAAARERPDVALIVAATLTSAGLAAEGYAAACVLESDESTQRASLRLQLEALYLLDLAESELYARTHARWLASRREDDALPPKDR